MIAPSFRLLAITPPEGPIHAGAVEAWTRASSLGVGVLLRQPGASLDELIPMIRSGRFSALADRCRAPERPLLLSLAASEIRRVAAMGGLEGICERTGARICGVQLRGDPGPAPIQELHRAMGPGWIGRSCHGDPQGGHGQVHYSCVAPIFPPTTAQPGVIKTAVGVGPLRSWSAQPGARIFALGGVGPATASACLRAGAWGLAGIGLFFGDPARVGEDVASVVQLVDRHLRDVRPLPQR